MKPVCLAMLLSVAAVVLFSPAIVCGDTNTQGCHGGTCVLPEEAAVRHPVAGAVAGAVRGSACVVGRAVGKATRVVTAPVRLIAKLKPIRRAGRGIAKIRPLRAAARGCRLILPGRRCRR